MNIYNYNCIIILCVDLLITSTATPLLYLILQGHNTPEEISPDAERWSSFLIFL